MKQRRSAGFNKYFCSNGFCTFVSEIVIDKILDPDSREFADVLKIPMSELDRDTTGKYWCRRPSCQNRYRLTSWGHAHNWPTLDSEPYEIVLGAETIIVTSRIEGKEQWALHAAIGVEKCILALLAAIDKELEVAS